MLERSRLEQGHYPEQLKATGKNLRLAYTTDGTHYQLKVWSLSLIFSTSSNGFTLKR